MALPIAKFPAAAFGGNEQDTTNDGSPDTSLAQADDYNQATTEIIAIEQGLRAGVIKAFWNDTGGILVAGTLVRIVGWNAANALPTVEKADAVIAGSVVPKMAAFVVISDVADAAAGNMAHEHTVTGLDTTGFIVGGPAYLSGTAGEFSITAQSPANEDSQDRNVRQRVGVCLIVNVALGIIHFDIEDEDLLLTPRLRGFDNPSQSVAATNPLSINDQVVDKYGVNIAGRFYGEVDFFDDAVPNEFDDNPGGLAVADLAVTMNIGTRKVNSIAHGSTKFYTNPDGTIQWILDSAVANHIWTRHSILGDGAPKTASTTWT